jgi:putative lipoprotein
MRGLLLVFSLSGAPSPSASPADAWFGQDKLKHFFMSAFVQSFAYGSLRGTGLSHGAALVGASATTTAVGVGKELRDLRVKGEFSPRDLAWDAAGAGVVTVFLSRTAR